VESGDPRGRCSFYSKQWRQAVGANMTDMPPSGCAQSASNGQRVVGQPGQLLGAEHAQLVLGSGRNEKVHKVTSMSGKSSQTFMAPSKHPAVPRAPVPVLLCLCWLSFSLWNTLSEMVTQAGMPQQGTAWHEKARQHLLYVVQPFHSAIKKKLVPVLIC